MPASSAILIRGLEFYGYHGVPDAEQATGHRYRADIRLRMDTSAAEVSDSVEDTVDYSAVAACLLEINASRRFRLVEALAAQICQTVLARFPQILVIEICLEKLLPPMNAIAASVGVEMTRFR